MLVDSALRASRRDPAVLAASVGANLLALATPMALLHIYDKVIPREGYETLAALGLIVLVSILFELALRAGRHVLLSIGAERFEWQAYRAAASSLVLEDPSNARHEGQGLLYTRLSGIERIRSLHLDASAVALLDLPFAFVFLGVITLLSPIVGATVLALMVISFICLRLLRRGVVSRQIARRGEEARRHSFLSDTLRGIASVHSLQIEDFMMRRHERIISSSARTTASLAHRMQLAQGFVASVSMLAPFLIATLGAQMVIREEMTFGTLAAIILLTGRIVQPVLRVEAFLAGADDASQAREDLDGILSKTQRKTGERPLSEVRTLTLAGVSVDRGPATRHGFRNLDLSLKTGDFLAVSAPVASAATEFLKLLTGEIAPTRGQILLNDTPISAYRLEDRKTLIRLMTRDRDLLQGTIIENMTGFQPDRYHVRAQELAQDLGIADVLAGASTGSGMQVRSHGQSQFPRSVADAVLVIGALSSDPDVVVVDDVGSSFDFETDRKFIELLRSRQPTRITVLVSNRPSRLALANINLDLTPYLETAVVGPEGAV